MLDFGWLPPEINSGRMYAGPGSASMMAAAGAWDGLAAELAVAASGYRSVISELTSAYWMGPVSASMMAAATPYATWLGNTAQLAEQAGMQARAAAAAYELAFAMTVPPPLIAANRVLLRALIATNFFGQNTPAIAATEAEYTEMWAQDAAAMYGYAGSSAVATQLSPFTAAPETTKSAGLGAQAAAVEAAAATPASTSAPSLSSMTTDLVASSTVTQALQQLATASLDPTDPWIVAFLGSLTTANRTTLARTFAGLPYFTLGMGQTVVALSAVLIPGNPASAGGSGSSVVDNWGPSVFSSLSPASTTSPGPVVAAPGGVGGVVGNVPLAAPHWAQPSHPGSGGSVFATMGKAPAIRGMTVPSGWVERLPGETPTGWEEPIQAVAPVRGAGVNGLLTGMNPSGGAPHTGGFVHKYGLRYKVMMRPPLGG